MRKRVWFGWAISAAVALAPAWGLAGEVEDNALASRVAAALKESGQLQSYRIGVSCKDGLATLEGDVTDNQQGVLALEIAKQTDGVTGVVNHLMCPAPGGATAPPAKPNTLASWTNRLKSALHLSSDSEPGEARLASNEVPANASPSPQALQAGGEAMAPIGGAAPTATRPQLTSRVVSRRPQPAQPQYAPQQYAAANRMAAMARRPMAGRRQMPHAYRQTGAVRPTAAMQPMPVQAMPPQAVAMGGPMPGYAPGAHPPQPAVYDQPYMPNYAWPSYAAYPNYAALTYPKQYSPTAWPYIGPFYPYPQVPLGWRKVTLEWDDGWWMLDFKD
jgi:hypothetical protein